MATGLLMDWNGFTEKDYDRVTEAMRLQTNPPKGCLFHCSGAIPGGWRVFDIWESREAFEEFKRERLDPALKQVGLLNRTPARSEFHPVHSAMAGNPAALNNLSVTMSQR
jgi:hypothetical protein